MANPITGPIISEMGGTGTDSATTTPQYYRKEKYTQAKPYDLALAYKSQHGTIVRASEYPNSAARGGRWAGAGDLWAARVPSSTLLYNQTYDMFRSKVSDRASLGVSLAELGESASMIQKRLLQLSGFTLAILRRNPQAAARALGIKSTFPRGRDPFRPGNSLARAWLEYWLGWAPMVGDIYNAVDVLQQDVPNKRVSASRSVPVRGDLQVPSQGSNPSAQYPAWTYWNTYERFEGTARVRIQADVRVSNPNLWLANSLGLVNPATVALELVPFSFVAEWFWNLGQVVQSFTDWYGLELTNSFVTRVTKGQCNFFTDIRSRYLERGRWVQTYIQLKSVQGSYSWMQRSPGPIPGPTFALRPYKVPGWQRVATASSLLNVLLSDVKVNSLAR